MTKTQCERQLSHLSQAGTMNMKSSPTAAILLSRQPLRPCGRTPWVRKSAEAVEWVGKRGFRLLTSTGMQTWEMLVYLAKTRDVPQTVFVPTSDADAFDRQKAAICRQFDLAPASAEFRMVESEEAKKNSAKHMRFRDESIVAAADVLLPVSVRPGGSMEKSIQKKRRGTGTEINEEFRVQYEKKRSRIAYELKAENLSSEIFEAGTRYIVHWTRASNGPWPAEKKGDFYAAVEKSDAYPRTACRTLENVLRMQNIVASSAHMPRNIPTVSFSGLAPAKILPLMKWRARYRIMSFEPYGIGVERNLAKRMGIEPVRYYEKGPIPRDIAPWLSQSAGKKTDWKREEEYRHKGISTCLRFDGAIWLAFADGEAKQISLRKISESKHMRSKFRAVPG